MSVKLISGVVLAGGQGRRMGGVDKGLQPLNGKPMVQWVLERFAPQVDSVLINANQNVERYAAFGYPVVCDRISGFAGPLAGLHAALSTVGHSLVATVPCDAPLLPSDLVVRLADALQAHAVPIAVARTHKQPHPVFCLCKREVLPNLSDYLESGGRRFEHWYAGLSAIEVEFDEAEAFSNINTLDDLNGLGLAGGRT